MQLADEADHAVGEVLPYVGRDHAGNRHWWRVSCRDAIDRERFLTVLTDRDQVVLVGPPGETAVLSPAQVGQLSEALREAADQAEG